MQAKELDIKSMQNWRVKVMVVGAVAGALIGVGGAYLFTQSAARAGNRPEVTPGDGFRLGLLVMGLLRQVAALGEGGKSK